jgi:catechol 2,3-dioxygenase-like lactoylglutathione lyase family enzyme
MRLVRDGGSAAELASVEPDDVKEHMTVDFALELVIIPVSDVDRAKDFYTQTLGFKLEVDGQANRGGRIVQVTPPGSACSIGFGTGLALDSGRLVTAPPGSQRGLHLAVSDLVAARDELIAHGVQVGEILHVSDGEWQAGLAPERSNYMSFAEFSDPDGNLWLLQEIRRGGE